MKLASHKRANIILFHLYEVCRVVKIRETESRVVVVFILGEKMGDQGNEELLFNK